jgi:hypothetical protein
MLCAYAQLVRSQLYRPAELLSGRQMGPPFFLPTLEGGHAQLLSRHEAPQMGSSGFPDMIPSTLFAALRNPPAGLTNDGADLVFFLPRLMLRP